MRHFWVNPAHLFRVKGQSLGAYTFCTPVLWPCHVCSGYLNVPHHRTHHCRCLGQSSHFVIRPTLACPSRPSSVITFSGKHSWRKDHSLGVSAVLHVCTSLNVTLHLAQCTSDFCLSISYTGHGAWRKGTVFFVFVFLVLEKCSSTHNTAFNVLLWIMVMLHPEIRGK